MNVLVIEDNLQNQYLVCFLLEHAGHLVTLTGDATEGIEQISISKPDIILLDIDLPGMDGYATAKHLRLLNGLETVPIVAITSHALLGDRDRAIAAGCNEYLEKPIDPDTFVAQIELIGKKAFTIKDQQ